MNLLLITLVAFLAIVATKFSNKSGIPALLLFLCLGVLFSSLGVEFNDFHLSNEIATISLIIIMFYGGFGTNITMARPVLNKAVVLSTLGVILTATLTGLFCHYVLKFGFLESMLLGSVVGSTDFASVSNILVSKNLNLKYNTASLLEVESGSNDPTAYTMTMIFVSFILGKDISIPALIIKQIVIALALGFLGGKLFFKITEKTDMDEDGIFILFIAASMIGIYAITDYFMGNGYLAVYIFGIYIGNLEFKKKRDVVFFYDGLSTIFQIAMFFLLGLLSNVGQIVKVIPQGLIIMIFMSMVIRPVVVYILMKPFKLKTNQIFLISFAGLRGAAAIAFAIMAINNNVNLSFDIFHTVFVICIFSLLIQGSLLPFVTDKLNMFSINDSVLRTFNYYSDKTEIGFIEVNIKENSPWINKKISDINISFNIIIAKIERDGKSIIPNGNTILKCKDVVVIGGKSYFDKKGEELFEINLGNQHEWVNKRIKDINTENKGLIIMIQKDDGRLIVPNGNTILEENDRIVLSK